MNVLKYSLLLLSLVIFTCPGLSQDGINEPPVALTDAFEDVLEDAGETVLNLNNYFHDPDGDPLFYSIIANPDVNLATASLEGSQLTLGFAANQSGQTAITVGVTDSMGSAIPQEFMIRVLPVNDAPSLSFSRTTFQYVNPRGPIVEDNWISFDPGPGEQDQAVAMFLVQDISQPGLFLTPPSVTTAGVLSFEMVAGISGESTFTIRVEDDGGSENGGTNLSEPYTILLSVIENQPPVALQIPDVMVLEDANPYLVNLFAYFDDDLDPDPNLSFTIENNDYEELLTASIDPAVGILSLDFNENRYGASAMTVRATDTESAFTDNTFAIDIIPVNDPPSITVLKPAIQAYQGAFVEEPGWASFSPGPFEASQTLDHYLITGVNPSFFTAAPTVNVAGDLTFATTNDASGETSFNIQAMDDGGVADGGVDTSIHQTVTLSILANAPPAITISGSAEAITGASYEYIIESSDPDANINLLEIVEMPAWLSQVSASLSEIRLSGSPSPSDKTGENTIEARAVDLALEETIETFNIEVVEDVAISFENLVQVYDGLIHQPTIGTTPSVTGLNVTYNDSSEPPTGAGTYAVEVVVTEPGYSGSASATMTIEKAVAQVNLLGLEQSFDGTPKPVSAITVPASLPVAFTYDGATDAPSAIGEYDVVASVNDPNYTGSASGTLVIAESSVTITISNTDFVFDGTTKSVTVEANPNVAYQVTYNDQSAAPSDAGTYAVEVVVTEPGYSGSAYATMTIEKAVAQVTLSGLEQSFDGTPKPVSAITVPASLPVAFTYDGATDAPSAIGEYDVVAAVNDPNYTGSASGTLVIAESSVTITISNTDFVFDGTTKSVTVEANPNVAYQVTYNDQSAAPSDAGTYAVEVVVTEPGYSGSASATMTIEKAVAQVTLSGLEQSFDGTPKPVSATTVPASLPVAFAYDGATDAPSAIGEYDVVASVNDPNYTGSASGTLVIAESSVTITISNTDFVFDGTTKSVTVEANPNVAYQVTYNDQSAAPSGAGTYAVEVVVTEPGYSGSASATMTIEKAVAQVTLLGLEQSFDGTPKPVSATTVPASLPVAFTYDGATDAPSAIGEYDVVASVNDPNYTGSASGTLVIAESSVTITISNTDFVFDGTTKSVTVEANPNVAYQVTYNDQSAAPSDAGTYAVEVVVTEPGYSGSASATMTIEKAVAQVMLSGLTRSYDGTPKVVSATTDPEVASVDITYNGSDTAPSAVGNYEVLAAIDDPNYTGSASGTLVISQGIAEITLSGLLHTYDESPKNASATTIPAGLSYTITYNGSSTAPVNAGTYLAIATITEEGYTGADTASLVIRKAEATITIGNLDQVYGAVSPVSITTDPADLNVAITYDNSVTIPQNAGTYQVRAVIDDPNYEGSQTAELIIRRRTAEVTLSGLHQNYDGQPKQVTVETNPAGLQANVLYNNSTNPPTAPGNYVVTVDIVNENYSGEASGTLIINGPPVVTSIPTQNISEDDADILIDLENHFNDVENDTPPLVYEVSSNSNPDLFKSITFENNLMTLSLSENEYGNSQITIKATDAYGLFAETSFIVNVAPLNDPPVFTTQPITEVLQDVEYLYDLSVHDPDHDPEELQITGESIPSWLTLQVNNDGTAILKGVPGNQQVGNHSIHLAVSDGYRQTDQLFTVTVINVNDPPYFESLPPTSAIKNQSYAYNIIVKDPDVGDARNISVIKKPSWLSFQNNGDGTARLSGTPRENHIHIDNSVILQASDNEGLATLQQFSITIISVNAPPFFTSSPDEEVNEGEIYQYNIVVNDPDTEDQLIIQSVVNPSWLTLVDNGDRTAVLSGTADDVNIGVNRVVLAVRDPAGVTVFQEFELQVYNVNEPPVFTSQPQTRATEKVPYRYTIKTTDPDVNDTWEVEAVEKPEWLNWSFVSTAVYDLTGTPAAADIGVHDVLLKAIDALGLETEQFFQIEVQNVNDAPGFLSVPEVRAVVAEEYSYMIVAADEDVDDHIVIEPVAIPSWLTLTDQGNRTAQLKGTPSQSGSYVVRIKVTDESGAQALQEYTIYVNTEPIISDFQKNILEDETLALQLVDFTNAFNDPDANSLTMIRITGLPKHGQLLFNGNVVQQSDEIPAGNLNLLRYVPSPNFFGADEFMWVGFDGYSYSENNAVAGVVVEPVNDAPQLLNMEPGRLVFVPKKDEPKAITTQLTIVDVDNETLAGAQVIFNSRSYTADEDLLVFENIGNIKGVFNKEAGALTFTGIDTRENYELALRSVKYDNVASNPGFEMVRSVNIYVDDGEESSPFVKRDISLENGLVELSIPSAFTPNGDNYNSYWTIRNIDLYPGCEVNVYSRTGSLVFHSTGYDQPWDGRFNGKDLPVGTYFYVIRLNEFDKTYSGSITIIR